MIWRVASTLAPVFQRPYSEATAQLIDEETKDMIAEQYARAKDILSKNAEGHAALAQLLVEREVIFAEDVERIFGPRPWASRTDELLTDAPKPTPEEENNPEINS